MPWHEACMLSNGWQGMAAEGGRQVQYNEAKTIPRTRMVTHLGGGHHHLGRLHLARQHQVAQQRAVPGGLRQAGTAAGSSVSSSGVYLPQVGLHSGCAWLCAGRHQPLDTRLANCPCFRWASCGAPSCMYDPSPAHQSCCAGSPARPSQLKKEPPRPTPPLARPTPPVVRPSPPVARPTPPVVTKPPRWRAAPGCTAGAPAAPHRAPPRPGAAAPGCAQRTAPAEGGGERCCGEKEGLGVVGW